MFADLISLLEKKLGFGPFHPNIGAAAEPRGPDNIYYYLQIARWIQFLGGKSSVHPSSNGRVNVFIGTYPGNQDLLYKRERERESLMLLYTDKEDYS
jgi:hypothetical protein